MSSYYERVTGNLKENVPARVADIHQIQTNIQDGEIEYTQDMFGANFILGGDEDSFKLTATTDYVDQVNTNCDEDPSKHWMSFYDRYLRQTFYTTKSSIESFTIHTRNSTNISTTIYAEIRDTNYNLIQEASTILNPTPDDEEYTETTFNFNKDHLPVGVYYFVLRPVDISATDLAQNGDETIYDNINLACNFLVKYDVNGEYHGNLYDYGETNDDTIIKGLEGSYDGSNYIEAYQLPEQCESSVDIQELDINDPNYDLFFEEKYSSGYTYLINPGRAIVLGQKVEPCDTHVKINAASDLGDRTDLVLLCTDGEYKVIEGSTYTGERLYPSDNSGLKIAYVTTFKNGEKVASIEQDDESELMTRPRSILERVRRTEKKTNYQMANNSPSRITYSCEVDPVMFNNGLSQEDADTEGSYRMGLSINEEGNQVISTNNSVNLVWSIIKNNYKHSYEDVKKISGYCQVYNVETGPKSSKAPSYAKRGLYVVYLSEENLKSENESRKINKPLKKENVKVVIKQGTKTKHTKTLTTNSNGRATWNLNKLGLKAGTYTVESTVSGNSAIKTKLKVHKSDKFSATTSHKTKSITLKDTVKKTVKETFNNNTITGDDAFDVNNVTVDTKNGIIELSKVNTDKDPYISNTTLKPNGSPKFSYSSHVYKIKSDKKATSTFPLLHLKFDRDTIIKSIRPNIKTFENLKEFGILFFKNDKVNNMRNHKRKTYEKNFSKDVIFPNLYKGTKSLSKVKVNNGKQTLDNFVTFTPKTPLEVPAGTYSLLVFGKLKNPDKDGKIYVREYDTHGNLDKYGMVAKCTGSSKLSTLKMSMSSESSHSWNVKITQKPDRYHTSGTVISNPKTTTDTIKECLIDKNISVPDGCTLRLYVSNDGGSKWIDATTTRKIAFNGLSNIFRWKMVLTGNGKSTPQLMYKENKKYAIKFSLDTQSFYVPYEDFGRCYETPLLNAYSITKTFVANSQATNKFNEWEWARIFMLDETEKSNIDLCFSYANDNNTNVSTLKTNWSRDIFFSQIFADLELSDFSQESIDYDNYDGNVEFDEHNFLFRMDSENVMHNTGGIAVAAPTYIGNSYEYGNIASNDNKAIINDLFVFTQNNDKYEYQGNEYNEPTQYAGEQLISGPYIASIYNSDTPYNTAKDEDGNDIKNKYVINGIAFYDGIDVDESKSELAIRLFPISGTRTASEKEIQALEKIVYDAEVDVSLKEADVVTKQQIYNGATGTEKDKASEALNTAKAALTSAQNALNTAETNLEDAKTPKPIRESGVFDAGSFTINVALTLDGTKGEDADNTTGISYTIPYQLKANEFATVYVNLGENLEGFKANGIRSIGIIANSAANLQKKEGIGIGTVTMSSYSRRPYVPYMYTGNWDRLKWKRLNDSAEIFNLCYGKNGTETRAFFYPVNQGDVTKETDDIINKPGGIAADIYSSYGTSINATNDKRNVASIERNKNQIIATDNNGKKYSTTNSGNAVVFKFPATTGDIFEIDTNIPFNIYDLVDIEYYMYNTYQNTTEEDSVGLRDNHITWNKRLYTYHGAISKGDIKIKFYTDTDIKDKLPVETFSLPSWGRIQQNAHVVDKTVHAWFKTRSNASTIRKIVIERANPTSESVGEVTLVLNNILLYNAETMPALGPQMQMRIYPKENLSEIQIRKVGCVYRI